jgi:hypothetical protein
MRIHVQADFFPLIRREHLRQVGLRSQPLLPPGSQHFLTDALFEVWHPLGLAKLHGFQKPLPTVHKEPFNAPQNLFLSPNNPEEICSFDKSE